LAGEIYVNPELQGVAKLPHIFLDTESCFPYAILFFTGLNYVCSEGAFGIRH
jgi:hypothetical protein